MSIDEEMEQEARQLGTGPTGKLHEGKKIRESDEGGLKAALCIDDIRKVIFMNFGKSVSWISMTAGEARTLSLTLTSLAEQLEEMP